MKRGEILIENIIFIILNLVFLSILILFLLKQGSGAIVLEESISKNIALMIDSARPVSEVMMYFPEAQKEAEENGISFNEIIKIEGNKVIVKLSLKGGSEYYFFNDVDVNPEATREEGEYTGYYRFTINEK